MPGLVYLCRFLSNRTLVLIPSTIAWVSLGSPINLARGSELWNLDIAPSFRMCCLGPPFPLEEVRPHATSSNRCFPGKDNPSMCV